MKKPIYLILKLILIVVIIFSGFVILSKYSRYAFANKRYVEIREISSGLDGDQSLIDINSDFKGWIKINNTKIDYPIVQALDNEYYLDKDIDKNSSISGSIFMDYRNRGFENQNTIIYGHNMRDKSMFANLRLFLDREFFESNNIISVTDIMGEEIEYKVFSAYIESEENDYLITEFNSEDEYSTYLNDIKEKSKYKNNIEINTDDKILTLSTCSFEFDGARIVVHAKRS